MSHTLTIHSVDGGVRWVTFLGDERLGELHDPLTDAARILLARGYHPDDKLHLKHKGNTYDSLTASIGWAAEHTVVDKPSRPPHFGRFKPFELNNNEAGGSGKVEREP